MKGFKEETYLKFKKMAESTRVVKMIRAVGFFYKQFQLRRRVMEAVYSYMLKSINIYFYIINSMKTMFPTTILSVTYYKGFFFKKEWLFTYSYFHFWIYFQLYAYLFNLNISSLENSGHTHIVFYDSYEQKTREYLISDHILKSIEAFTAIELLQCLKTIVEDDKHEYITNKKIMAVVINNDDYTSDLYRLKDSLHIKDNLSINAITLYLLNQHPHRKRFIEMECHTTVIYDDMSEERFTVKY